MAEQFQNVKGLSDLQKFLDQLPVKMEKNVMRGAMRAGMKHVETQAKSNAPVGKPNSVNARLYGGYAGALRDSIRLGTSARGGKVTAYVRAGGKNKRSRADVFYAHFVEFGTRAHTIAAKGKGWLAFAGVFVKKVSHPGTAPKPFMRPALDSQATTALNTMAVYIRDRLASKHGLDTADVKLEGDE